MVQKKDKNLGGEPITVSAATSALLLEAVSDYYRQQHKNKKSIKGGATSGMMGSSIESSHLLLDAGEAAERPFTQAAVGATVGGSKNKNKKSKNNNLEGGALGLALQLHPGEVPTTTILTDPATAALPGVGNQLGGKKNKKSKKDDKKNGGDGADMNASYMLPATGVMGGNNKKNKKKDKKQQGGDSVGYAHNFSSDRSDMHAGVADKLTILMGGKNKKDNKKDKNQQGGNHSYGVTHDHAGNRSTAAGVDTPYTLMGGKKDNKNGGGDIGVATYNVAGSSVMPEPPVQMGGKKKRVSRKNKEKGGDGEEAAVPVDMSVAPPAEVSVAPPAEVPVAPPAESPVPVAPPAEVPVAPVGGNKNRRNNKNEDKQDGGKKKRESRKNKDKKLVGGLQELNALLGALSGGK
jgi:hypothetical protein